MQYQTPAILTTIDTAEVMAEAFGAGSNCTPMGHTCH